MAWLKIDDAMGEHRKTRRLMKRHGLAPFGLHALALLHCSRYLTDGRVEAEFVDEALDDAKVKPRDRDTIVGALVESGQWDIDPNGGWIIHDYLRPLTRHAHRSRHSVRRTACARRRVGATGSPGRGLNPLMPARVSAWIARGIHPESWRRPKVPSRPVPSRPSR